MKKKNDDIKTTVSILGWYGVLAILTAYALVSFEIVVPQSWAYQLLNLTGALGLIVEASSKKDTQPVVLNVVWAAVAVIGLLQLL